MSGAEEKSLIARILTIGGVLATAGIVGLISMFGQLSAIKTEVVNFRASINALETQVTSATLNRYTASDATQDRSTFAGMVAEYSRSNHELYKALMDRVDAHGKEISELRERQARMEGVTK